MAKVRTPAVAYLRTSSATNVRADKDSDKRQRAAIHAFARRAGFEIAGEFYDEAVSGADPIEGRKGFAALLDRTEGNGVRIVIVEDASRFARELMVQELGITLLIKRGVRLLTASGDDLTASNDPTRTMMRQIAGSFAEYEKARLVGKLRAARDRIRNEKGRCEGRQPLWQTYPEAVLMAKRLHRANPKTGKRLSLRKISAELAAAGHVNVSQYRNRGNGSSHVHREEGEGRPFNSATIRTMIEGPSPPKSPVR